MIRIFSPYFFWVLFLAFLFFLPESARAQQSSPPNIPVFKFNFENGITNSYPVENHTIKLTNSGGEIVTDGISGKALRLNKNAHVEIDPQGLISTEAGAIIFWMRPHWNYYDRVGDTLTSHAFVSFEWDNPKKGYFVISDGWWEPSGSLKTYFIFDNQQKAHTSAVHKFQKDYWIQMACSWDMHSGIIRLYIDGMKISESKVSLSSPGKPKKLFIGTDKGTNLAKNRWADCDFDELIFYDSALSSETIEQIYKQSDPDPQGRYLNYLKNTYATAPVSKSASLRPPIRAIFDEGTGWMSQSGATETIQRIKKAGFNVYIPCVWHGRGTRYPSPAAPPEPDLNFRGEDPLARVINIAHSNGIEVHPWFCVTLRQRDFLEEYYDAETPENAFDIHRPSFQSFMASLIKDVVNRYEVDGINLDYIRTMGLCKCDYCQTEYSHQFGRNLSDDSKKKGLQGGLQPQLQQWQDSGVEDLVRLIAHQCKNTRNVLISVCGSPRLKYDASNPEGRQEIRWANLNIIEKIFVMEYSYIPDFDMFDMINQEANSAQKIIPLFANYHRLNGILKPKNDKLMSAILKYAGVYIGPDVGLYLYSQLSDSQVESLFSTNGR